MTGVAMNRVLLTLLSTSVVVFLAASTVGAQQWDLWDETGGTAGFDGINPDGSWSFHYGDTLVSTSHGHLR